MKRREFLKYFSTLSILFYLTVNSIKTKEVNDFYNEDFDFSSMKVDINNIIISLKNKDILKPNGDLDLNKLQDLAKTDTQMVVNNSYYTQSEVELYILSAYMRKEERCFS